MDSDKEPFAVFDRVVGPVLGLIAGILLFCLMILTCIDVVGRYFFGMPVTGGFELTEMMLAALIFFGLPLVTIRNEHVMVDLLDTVTPDWLLRIQHAISCLVCAVATGYLAWRLWLRAVSMAQAGETTAQLKLQIPYLTFSMSVLMALTALAFLVLACRRPARQIAAQV
jgi:TRAP-type C4-dicarboxylate transport system permease small subunit